VAEDTQSVTPAADAAVTPTPAIDDTELAAFRAWKAAQAAGDAASVGPDGLAAVTIVKPFKLTLDPHLRADWGNFGDHREMRAFGVGAHRLPVELASHWYVRQHSDDPPATILPEGSEIYKSVMKRKELLKQSLPPESEARVLEALMAKIKSGELKLPAA
jgi:hypothetical protein